MNITLMLNDMRLGYSSSPADCQGQIVQLQHISRLLGPIFDQNLAWYMAIAWQATTVDRSCRA